MITREQVKDLQPGDVVEYHRHDWPKGVSVRGPLCWKDGDLDRWIGLVGPADLPIRFWDGSVNGWASYSGTTLTVTSRAKPPLYVNSDKTEPDPGDVVRDDDGTVWLHDSWKTWHSPDSTCSEEHQDTQLTQPLRLLVDGRTGQVVQ